MYPVDHDPIIDDLVAQREHRVVTAAVNLQRGTHPHVPVSLSQGGTELPDPIRQGLHRDLWSEPVGAHITGGRDVQLDLLRDRHHRWQLKRIPDDDGSLGPLDRPCGLLRAGLPGLVDQHPSQGLRFKIAEHPAE